MNRLLLLLLMLVGGWCQVANAQSLEVRLRPNREMSYRSIIRLGDIADIYTTSTTLRRTVENLDVLDWSLEDDSIKVPVNLVQLRLQLALPNVTRKSVTGAGSVLVEKLKLPAVPKKLEPIKNPMLRSLAKPKRDDRIVILGLQTDLAEAWRVNTDMVRVRLLQPLPSPFDGEDQERQVDKVDVVLPRSPRTGRMSVALLGYQDDQLIATKNVLVDAQLYGNVAVMRRDLQAGSTITSDDIESVLKPIRLNQRVGLADELIGKRLNASLKRGETIESRHLSRLKPKNVQSVKARDTVRLTAKRGSLSVTVTDAVALQSGVIGDQIRVRNPRTRKVLTARVVGPGLLEVEIR